MDRKQLIAELQKYFNIRELVCREVYKAFGNKSWQFFDTMLLHTLLVLRTGIHKNGMLINNWQTGGPLSQRGLRCNICQICRDKTKEGSIYMSAHANGAAFDYDVIGQTAEQSRNQVKANESLLPYRVRLEKNVSWVHIDVYDDPDSTAKITEF